MKNEDFIPAQDFCKWHNIEISFVDELENHGLVNVTTIEGRSYFSADQLDQVEKLARMHADLGINMAGLDAIIHLLSRVERLQQELITLRNKLCIYEPEN